MFHSAVPVPAQPRSGGGQRKAWRPLIKSVFNIIKGVPASIISSQSLGSCWRASGQCTIQPDKVALLVLAGLITLPPLLPAVITLRQTTTHSEDIHAIWSTNCFTDVDLISLTNEMRITQLTIVHCTLTYFHNCIPVQ